MLVTMATPISSHVKDKNVSSLRAIAYVASVSVRFRRKERGTRVKDRVSFLARPKPRIPFLGLSLLRNQTETLATQAMRAMKI